MRTLRSLIVFSCATTLLATTPGHFVGAQAPAGRAVAAGPLRSGPDERSDAVQWAARVVGASSEGRGAGGGQQWKAAQALGPPSVLPQVVESPCAWSPTHAESATDEWIRVAFERPQLMRQLIIAESANPGAIVQVIVYDTKGNERVLLQATAPPAARPDPVTRLYADDPALVVREVKVVINPARTRGINQIDAIGISASKDPYRPAVNVSADAPRQIEKESLGSLVNSPGQEIAPVLTPDGRTLYFTRCFHPKNVGSSENQDVWYTQLGAGNQWGEAVNVGAPINNADHNAISSISPDGRTIYLNNVYEPGGGLVFGISRSVRTRTGWSFPVECKIKNHYNLHRDHNMEFAVSPNGAVMVIAVQRRDTYGDRDLYVTFRQPDQTWTEPRSMGPVINSADVEATPFIAADNRTLYFTSDGFPGYGRGDIFVTRRLDDTWTNWSRPENLGPGINTPEWDGYFTIPAAGEYAYFSSQANSVGKDDIFRFKTFAGIRPDPVAIVSGQVLDAITKKPVSSSLLASLLTDTTSVLRADVNPETGEYRLIVPTQQVYKLMATKAGYFPLSEPLDLSRDKRFRDIRRNLYLTPIQAGQKITLRDVLFAQSKFELLPGATADLDHIADMLRQYPVMEILVEGHTDNQGAWEPNLKLSEDRVRVVKAYLTGRGIAPNRIQTKAWGPSKPIASNETEEKRKLNRRVEFTILKL